MPNYSSINEVLSRAKRAPNSSSFVNDDRYEALRQDRRYAGLFDGGDPRVAQLVGELASGNERGIIFSNMRNSRNYAAAYHNPAFADLLQEPAFRSLIQDVAQSNAAHREPLPSFLPPSSSPSITSPLLTSVSAASRMEPTPPGRDLGNLSLTQLIERGDYLRPGDRGKASQEALEMLQRSGHFQGDVVPVYTMEAVEAGKSFQRERAAYGANIGKPDGLIGRRTLPHMQMTLLVPSRVADASLDAPGGGLAEVQNITTASLDTVNAPVSTPNSGLRQPDQPMIG